MAEILDRLLRAETDEDFQAIERELGGRWICETLADVAEAFGYHISAIKGWRSEGMPGVEGAWRLPDIIQWRIAKAERKAGPDDESERSSRRRIAAVKAARDELRLKRELGQVIDVDEAAAVNREILSLVRARVEALPGEIAASISADQRAKVFEESTSKCRMALRELGDGSLSKRIAEPEGEVGCVAGCADAAEQVAIPTVGGIADGQ